MDPVRDGFGLHAVRSFPPSSELLIGAGCSGWRVFCGARLPRAVSAIHPSTALRGTGSVSTRDYRRATAGRSRPTAAPMTIALQAALDSTACTCTRLPLGMPAIVCQAHAVAASGIRRRPQALVLPAWGVRSGLSASTRRRSAARLKLRLSGNP
jgi:hypothetical protein